MRGDREQCGEGSPVDVTNPGMQIRGHTGSKLQFPPRQAPTNQGISPVSDFGI